MKAKKCPKCKSRMFLVDDGFIRIWKEPLFIFTKEKKSDVFVCEKCHFMEFYMKDKDFEETF